jgi:hypothetical protein
LNNRAAIGEFQPHARVDGVRKPDGDSIPSYFPAVVDEDIFYRAISGREERRNSGRGRKGEFITNLFSGLAKCYDCGSSMKYENKGAGPKGGQYLVCQSAHRKLGCETVRWRYSDFEQTFLAFVRELDVKAILQGTEEVSDQQRLTDEIASLEGQLTQINTRMERDYALLDSGAAIGFVTTKLNEHEIKKKGLSATLATKVAELQSISNRIFDYESSRNETQQLLHRLNNLSEGQKYQIRSELSASLKALILTLRVAPSGRAPSIKRNIERLRTEYTNGADDVIALWNSMLAEEESLEPFFLIGFKDGSIRYVRPDPNDPLKYIQQLEMQNGQLLDYGPGYSQTIWR